VLEGDVSSLKLLGYCDQFNCLSMGWIFLCFLAKIISFPFLLLVMLYQLTFTNTGMVFLFGFYVGSDEY